MGEVIRDHEQNRPHLSSALSGEAGTSSLQGSVPEIARSECACAARQFGHIQRSGRLRQLAHEPAGLHLGKGFRARRPRAIPRDLERTVDMRVTKSSQPELKRSASHDSPHLCNFKSRQVLVCTSVYEMLLNRHLSPQPAPKPRPVMSNKGKVGSTSAASNADRVRIHTLP